MKKILNSGFAIKEKGKDSIWSRAFPMPGGFLYLTFYNRIDAGKFLKSLPKREQKVLEIIKISLILD